MESSLSEKVEKWLSLPFNTLGEKENAEEYYKKEVFPLSLELFIEKEGEKLNDEDIFGLILTVGKSIEPLIFSISACSPEKVVFLFTSETEECLDEIVKETKLTPSQFYKRKVDETDTLSIYKEVLGIWENWEERKDIAVDITGGTKSMTGGLAMAAAFLGVKLLYIASGEYLGIYRRPKPGTEYIKILPNPYTVFASLQEREAKNFFQRHDFHGSAQILKELIEKVPDPRKIEIDYYQAKAYEELSSFNIKDAAAYMTKTVELKKKLYPGETLNEIVILEEQRKRMEHLGSLMPEKAGESILPLLQDIKALETLIFTLYHNALRCEDKGSWDMASLLIYRLLEIFEQRRLASYDIDTANPNYKLLSAICKKKLLDSINIKREELKITSLNELPYPISMVDGYMLLEVINDPFNLGELSKEENKEKKVHWKKFYNEINKRNSSIFAHGFIFVSKEQYEEFKKMGDIILKLFCKVEGLDFKSAFERYEFLEL